MSATNPDQTPAPHPVPSNASAGSEQPAWLRWFTPQVTRMVLWLGVAAIGTCAMGSAVNRFSSKSAKDQSANVAGSVGSSAGDGGPRYGIWWNPTTASVDASSKSSGVKFDHAPSSNSGGSSVVPVERNIGFSSGSLIMNGSVSIGSNSSRAAYAVLDLGTRSFSAPSISPSFTSGATSELHFSLSGDVNLVPVDNLSAGSLSLVAVPEPSTGGLLAVALAGLALRRRRKPVATA